jgi:hypothetical protein
VTATQIGCICTCAVELCLSGSTQMDMHASHTSQHKHQRCLHTHENIPHRSSHAERHTIISHLDRPMGCSRFSGCSPSRQLPDVTIPKKNQQQNCTPTAAVASQTSNLLFNLRQLTKQAAWGVVICRHCPLLVVTVLAGWHLVAAHDLANVQRIHNALDARPRVCKGRRQRT